MQALDEALLKQDREAAFATGLRGAAICFMDGYRFTAHEQAAKRLALQAGFIQVGVSHEVSPMMKFVSRGDTTVVDAYLSPILRFDGARLRVGPQSAGANPGQACYRRGGPLTVTDANLLPGKIQPDWFPKVFGPDANQALDLRKMASKHGLPRVQTYMRHGQDNAEEMVRRVITRLKDGHFALPLDNGAQIQLAIRFNAQERGDQIDFSGTSKQQSNNFNAPWV